MRITCTISFTTDDEPSSVGSHHKDSFDDHYKRVVRSSSDVGSGFYRKDDDFETYDEALADEEEEEEIPDLSLAAFASGCSLHGANHVFVENQRLSVRQCLWGIVFVLAISAFLFQVFDRVMYYSTYDHVTMLDERNAKNMTFPAITLCNYNTFRRSQLSYSDLLFMGPMLGYEDNMAPGIPLAPEPDRQGARFSLAEFFNRTRFRMEDMMLECVFSGQECGPEHWREVRRRGEEEQRTGELRRRGRRGDERREQQLPTEPRSNPCGENSYHDAQRDLARRVPEAGPSFLTPAGLVSSKTVLRGEQLLLECIAAGVPTPSIKWFKKGGDLPMKRVRLERFNKTLRIINVSEEDSGDYNCMANNKIASIQHTISVQVKASPYWLDKPQNLVLGPDENGRMTCIAHGNPKPSIQWLVNGEPIEGSQANPTREVQGDTIIFRRVLMGDNAVYQCNASNEHGYLLANAFVNVLDMAPRMLGPKNQLIKVIENNRTLLHCPFFGSPIPILRWFKNGLGSGLDGGHYRVYVNGSLLIKKALTDDQGTYTCVASNILGKAENQVRLEVKEPTRIVRAPEHVSATRGTTVRFNCRVKHDSTLTIQVTWLKNDEPLSFGWRIKKDEESLTIPNINEGDEGTYTCHVKTEIDEDSASARLIVLEEAALSPSNRNPMLPDRPEAPKDLELSDPLARSIRLTWVPGDDNNSPITDFLVQFEEDRWEPRKWQNLSSHPGNMNSVLLELSPFVNYQFRVIAINAVGQSTPSRPSKRYQTSGAAPDLAPEDIKGVGSKKNNMEITWKPLSDIQRNGPNIVYEVSWKKKDAEEWESVNTTRAKHVIHDTEIYEPFHIKVQAINDFGRGPESPVVLGYSGEDYPSAAPANLNVSKIDSTKVNMHWDTVDPSTVHGEFKEYRLYYWRESSLVKGLKVNKEQKTKGFFSSSGTGILTDLVPYSHYKMYMVVANSRYEGPHSNTVEFKTKEGVPDAPKFFKIVQRSSSTLHLQWDKPLEPNGNLIGYTLQYHTVNGTQVGNRQVESFLPNVTAFTLRLPDRSTRYKFYLVARTQVGAGEVYAEESPNFSNEAITTDSVDIATQGWFIGLMCAIALIVLILLIVCFIKRSRGGKYPVRDKKDLPLDPVAHKDQDGSFDYHSDEDNKPLQGSQTSLDGNVKESDDSLVDYGEGNDGQFNEDGSFIGQYTVKKDKEETEGNESSEATSPVNAIYSLA
ncbi:hypothetical protein ACEWY4_013141 [Coilia grayii]|uniref:Neurofascin n=1 Tax=Coilia grayii TaxID=363190 RepID=A0ABD1JVG0_9TELE